MKLQEGTILYFHLFHFKNSGTPPKSKYFIVIKHIGDTTLLASLPSSQKHLPRHLQSTYGCLEIPDSGIGCYAFQSGVSVATNNFAFPLDSYLFGQHLDEYNSLTINDMYPFEGINYDILGCLKIDTLVAVIDCFKNSASVKRRFRRLL